MPSALAEQLRQTASLNAKLLRNAANRINNRESYLFTGQEAARHDPESIHGLAYNAFLQLEALEPKFSDYEDELFSDSVKMQDRTLLNQADNDKLNATLDAFLRLLSGHLLLEPSGRVLEWLIRHFRITEFNVDGILACFLPYHDSPLFTRILVHLHTKEHRGPVNWAFLEPFKKIAQPMPRDTLVVAMDKDSELLRFIANMLPRALQEGSVHRAFINFYTVTLLAFIKKQTAVDQNLSGILLPEILPILDNHDLDATLGAYMLLVSVSRKTRMTQKALQVLLTSIAKSYRSDIGAAHLISALVAICASQEQLDSVQKKTASALVTIPEIDIWLSEACTIIGSEALLQPLISTMVANLDDRHTKLLIALINSNKLSDAVVSHACITVARYMAQATEVDGSTQFASAKELGALLQQRHPTEFSTAVKSLKDEQDAELMQRLENVVAKLAVTEANIGIVNGDGGVLLGSYSADAAVRATCIQQVLDSFANKEDLSPETLTSLCGAVLARVADTEVEVLQALYADPEKLLDAVPTEDLFAAIKNATSVDLPRKQLLLHLIFIALELVKQRPDLSDRAFFDIFLPHLLFTKSQNIAASAAWNILLSGDVARLPLLQGVADLVETTTTEEADGVKHDRLAELNSIVTKRIADNIVTSDDYKVLAQAFIRVFADSRISAQLFAGFVVKALLARLSGEHQVELGHEVVRCLEAHPEPLFVADEDVTEKLDEDVYYRTKAVRTSRQVQIALLCAVAEGGRPLNVKLDFLCDAESIVEEDSRGLRYVTLLRMVYQLMSADGAASAARTHSLKRLFTALNADCLLLLAGIWAGTACSPEARESALAHGRAILRSHGNRDVTDFQVIMPSLVVALTDRSKPVREAATQCVKALAEVYGSGQKTKSLYALDAVYGILSSQVQYLDRSDVAQYIDLLLQHADEMVLDGSVLTGFHTASLVKQKGEGRKTAAFKEKTLYFLLSHVVAWRSAHSREALLQSLSNVHSAIKLELLIPVLRKTAEAVNTPDDARRGLEQPLSASVSALLMQIFDETAISSLNTAEETSFSVLKSCITVPLTHSISRVLFDGTLVALRTVYKGLSREKQLELLQLCLDTIVASEQAYAALKQLFSELLGDTVVITDLIRAVRPEEDVGERSIKRVKVDEPASSESSSVNLRRLSLLVEVISTKAFPGDINLISVLLETVGVLSNVSSLSSVDVDYAQQLIMLAIMNNAAALPSDVPRPASSLRVDIIVDLIRSTNNPQTSRQALLTVGSLARLSNESILHNVMPIFMFMGSTVFQNDDAYSFSVISKTIDSIVPVMIKSLKDVQSTKLDLYLRSRDFLRIFTDASTHIPRHRRSKFFLHLVDVLGHEDFLAPICMLLVDNVAFKAVKQKAVDLPASFSIPLTCLQKRTVPERLAVLLEVLEECQRLLKRLADPSRTDPVTFLDMSKSIDTHERTPTSEVAMTRQVQGLLLFVTTAIELLKTKAASEDSDLDTGLQRLVSQLLEMSVNSTEKRRDKVVSTAAFGALDKAMTIISVPIFAHAMQSMLETEDAVLQSAAISLTTRLNNTNAKARKIIAPSLTKIIARLVVIVKQSDKDPTAVHGLRAFEIIARTAMSGEEAALAQAIGPLIQYVADKPTQQQSVVLNILDILLGKLGPRLIPNLLPIIELCGSIIATSTDAELRAKAFTLLASVLKTLPNFIGSYLSRVLKIGLDISLVLPNEVEQARRGLLQSVAKNIDGKTLLPALEKIWQDRSTEIPSVVFLSLYLNLLQRSVRAAERAVVIAELRSLFKLFLELFDIRAVHYPGEAPADFQATEATSIAAFQQVVIKLNESAFKPFFRRLYDWHIEGGKAERGITFYRLVGALLDQLKGIITPYMSILFDRCVELLREYAAGKEESGELWIELLEVLRKSFDYDQGAFWRDNTMTKLMTPLVDQIEVSSRITIPSYSAQTPNATLAACLATFSKSASDDTAKALNLAVWMKGRSDSVETKLTMLACAQAIWKRDGERLAGAGYAPETVAFLVECLEDENEAVENEARAFQKQLTKLVGPLDALID